MTGPLRVVLIQAAFDTRMLLRNGEQVLLTLLIPLGLLLGLTLVTAIPLPLAPGASRVDTALAGVLAVAVLSSAFTSLAIGVGFDRRAGALLMLATTPLSKVAILASRSLATVLVGVLQSIVLGRAATAMGWRASVSALAVSLVLILVGTLSLGSLGMALGGAVRAEATLAIANAVFLILLVAGGTAWPTQSLPEPLGAIMSGLPSAALGDGLRTVLAGASGSVPVDALVMCGWLAIGVVVAARTFRWE